MADGQTGMDIVDLVAEHHEAVYAYAYRLSGEVPDAEDLTQQVFLVAQQKLGQLRNTERARGWLFTILRNCFLKTRQRRRPVAAVNLELDVDTIPAPPPAAEDIDQERLQAAINELPEEFRVVLVMFYFEACSYREIAEKLDVPTGTVMSRLARAKGRIRANLVETQSSPSHHQQPSTVR